MTTIVGDCPDNWIPGSTEEWHQWLLREEEATIRAYREKPSNLIADYHRERAIARDYEGREILELLQNANDQAAEIGQPGRVLLEVSQERMIVANTGMAFSVGGVASLQTSHLSPKRHRRQHFIGNKGLGFRSVLNWSKTPIIMSKALCLAYCTEHAKDKLKALIDSYPAIARVVQEEQQHGDALILPLLLFPLFSKSGDLQIKLSDERRKGVHQRCKALLTEGYETAIGMPFDIPTGFEAACAQLEEIPPEIMLFASHLGELCFCHNGETSVTWRSKRNNGVVEVIADDKSMGKWHVHRKAGKLPDDVVILDQSGATDFEIVVAVSLVAAGPYGPLYSYFPTDIIMPLPVVCHATIELEQSRKHMQQGRGCNRFVLGRLAEYIAEIAESLAEQNTTDHWAGCSILIPKTDYPDELKREGFPDKLIESAKARRIVPTLSGELVTADRARLIPGANPSWLPSTLFPDVVPIRDEADSRFLITIGVTSMDVLEIRKRILAAKDMSVDQRVGLIAGLLAEGLKAAYTSKLLLDSSGDSLEDGMRVFIAPGGGDIPKLPNWVERRFLDEEMRVKLAERLNARDNRDLQQKLSEFGVLEYSLANVIRSLIAAANRAEKSNPEHSVLYLTELLQTVYNLYLAEKSSGKPPEFPALSPLYLPNQQEERSAASSLYLGRGFGTQGEITQTLYENWAPEKLLDAQRLPNISGQSDDIREFLHWIGVAQWPRVFDEKKVNDEYLKHVLRTIRYPVRFEEKEVASASEAHGAHFTQVSSIEGLNDILTKADPASIIAWLANDDRSLAWGRESQWHASLWAFPGGVHKARYYGGPLPSYIRWSLESTPWLRSSDGIPLKPMDCLLGERAIEDLFPRPAMPPSETMDRYGIQWGDVLEGWRRAGVLPGLAYLEWDQIYAKLLELPKRSPDGKLARPLYLWLLKASESAIGREGPNQKEFFSSGKMWGRHGKEERYFPINELHHADAEGLPDTLLNRLKIVDLRKRVGAEKVEKLFGVKPVDRAGIERRVVAKEIAVGSSQANTNFQEAKPYLHKLRASQTSQLTQLHVLKELQLEVCSTLRAQLTFDGELIVYDVSVWGWAVEDKVLYVRSDPAKPLTPADSLLADAIGEALASIFRIVDGGDFARMLACKEEDRLFLLQRLCGELVPEDIEAIRAEYASFKPGRIVSASFPIVEPPRVVPPQGDTTAPAGIEPTDVSPPPVPESEVSRGSLKVVPEEHIPNPPSEPRKLQIKTVTPSDKRPHERRHRVTDGDFCERKAMEFEEACIPKRWPIAVGQIMGLEGPGCDVLSFETEEAHEKFRVGPVRDLNTVARFIEVKGRGSSGATIELRGTELSVAAGNNADRYFLYRLFEIEDGTFELAILRNPLLHKEALQPAVHVSMERAIETQRFSLIGGLKRE